MYDRKRQGMGRAVGATSCRTLSEPFSLLSVGAGALEGVDEDVLVDLDSNFGRETAKELVPVGERHRLRRRIC